MTTVPRPPFPTRAEHEAAFEVAAQIGPQPGIPAVDVLPPLPHLPEALAAMAALRAPEDAWVALPIEQVDPRVPWRAGETRGWFRWVRGVGPILIRGAGPTLGWEATMLTEVQGRTVEHRLVHRGPRQRPVRFDDVWAAQRELEPVVMASGAPGVRWEWSPALGAGQWAPLPLTGC